MKNLPARWSDEARERQRQVCRETQPWKSSPSGQPKRKAEYVHEALAGALAMLGKPREA